MYRKHLLERDSLGKKDPRFIQAQREFREGINEVEALIEALRAKNSQADTSFTQAIKAFRNGPTLETCNEKKEEGEISVAKYIIAKFHEKDIEEALVPGSEAEALREMGIQTELWHEEALEAVERIAILRGKEEHIEALIESLKEEDAIEEENDLNSELKMRKKDLQKAEEIVEALKTKTQDLRIKTQTRKESRERGTELQKKHKLLEARLQNIARSPDAIGLDLKKESRREEEQYLEESEKAIQAVQCFSQKRRAEPLREEK